MDALPKEARTRNVSMRETCKWCLNHGLVQVGVRPSKDPDSPFEVYGPCPYCERGFACEFPDREDGGPWGSEGFWKGRDPSEAAGLVPASGGQPLSILANHQRVQELLERMEAATAAREQAERELARANRDEALEGAVGDLAETGSAEVDPGEGSEEDPAEPLPVLPPETPASTGLFT